MTLINVYFLICSNYQEVARLVNAVAYDVTYRSFQWTYLAEALTLMTDYLFTNAQGDRSDARNVAIVLTDGRPEPWEQEERTIPAIREAQYAGIKMYAIGITEKVHIDMLRELSSYPHIINENYFESPITAGIGPPIHALREDICVPIFEGPTTWAPIPSVGGGGLDDNNPGLSGK